MATKAKELFSAFGSSSTEKVYGGTSTIALVAGDWNKILSFQVPDKMAWVIDRIMELRMKLKNASGVELGRNARIMLAVKKPGKELPVEIGSSKLYSPFREVSINLQNNNEYREALNMVLDRTGSLDERTQIQILVDPGTDFTLSWPHSEIYLPKILETDKQ